MKQIHIYCVIFVVVIVGLFCFSQISASGKIVISELQLAGSSDTKDEWIELYNPSDVDMDLTGYKLIKKTKGGPESNLVSASKFLGTIPAKSFFLISHPDWQEYYQADLSYSGSSYSISADNTILILDIDGVVVDKVGFGEASDFESKSAPNPEKGQSLARKDPGSDTDNNYNDFEVSASPTPGKINTAPTTIPVPENNPASTLAPAPLNQTGAEKTSSVKNRDKIIITELYPNPSLDTNGQEFFEIYNPGTRVVYLKGWAVEDGSGKRFNFPAINLGAGVYRVFYRIESNIVLNNSGDNLRIFAPNETKARQNSKFDNAPVGKSFQLYDSEWTWNEKISPGVANQKPNRAPEIEIGIPEKLSVGEPAIFNASDTDDPENDTLFYLWDFGDGIKLDLVAPQHTYLQSGEYQLSLTVNDGHQESSEKRTVYVISDSSVHSSPFDILINEVLPNPVGDDLTGEWIELYNAGEENADLGGWTLKDSSASGAFTFSPGSQVSAKSFLLIHREQSKLSLNNLSDSVELLDPERNSVDRLEYSVSVVGQSYARGLNDRWFWTDAPTPGEKNIISNFDIEASTEYDYRDIGTQQISGSKIVNSSEYIEYGLDQLDTLSAGDRVQIFGTVTAEPGVLGSQIFYVGGIRGMQIYSYYKKFPELVLGDYISVRGELSEVAGEKRIKTVSEEDIKLIYHGDELEVQEIKIADIDQSISGELVAVSGRILEKKSPYLYFADDEAEIRIQIKESTGIQLSDFAKGENLRVIGIVSFSTLGARILPRRISDIEKIDSASEDDVPIIGERDSVEWNLTNQKEKMDYKGYLLIISLAVIIILSILLYQKKTVDKS